MEHDHTLTTATVWLSLKPRPMTYPRRSYKAKTEHLIFFSYPHSSCLDNAYQYFGIVRIQAVLIDKQIKHRREIRFRRKNPFILDIFHQIWTGFPWQRANQHLGEPFRKMKVELDVQFHFQSVECDRRDFRVSSKKRLRQDV